MLKLVLVGLVWLSMGSLAIYCKTVLPGLRINEVRRRPCLGVG